MSKKSGDDVMDVDTLCSHGTGTAGLGTLKCHFSHCFDFCVNFFCGRSVSYLCNVGND